MPILALHFCTTTTPIILFPSHSYCNHFSSSFLFCFICSNVLYLFSTLNFYFAFHWSAKTPFVGFPRTNENFILLLLLLYPSSLHPSPIALTSMLVAGLLQPGSLCVGTERNINDGIYKINRRQDIRKFNKLKCIRLLHFQQINSPVSSYTVCLCVCVLMRVPYHIKWV